MGIQVHFTEHKSVGKLPAVDTMVRVFVDNDYTYGYFVREAAVVALLDEDQRKDYLAGVEARLEVSVEVAQEIIDMGLTPYAKPNLIARAAAKSRRESSGATHG